MCIWDRSVPVPWRPCRVSRCRAVASRTSTRRAACHRCRRAVGWARWAWPWAWRWALARARASSNATTVTRAASPVHRVTNLFTSDTGQGPRVAPLSHTTPRAWTSIIRTPARPVSVYRTHCTRCLHFSRRTTTDNTLSSFPVMDYIIASASTQGPLSSSRGRSRCSSLPPFQWNLANRVAFFFSCTMAFLCLARFLFYCLVYPVI